MIKAGLAPLLAARAMRGTAIIGIMEVATGMITNVIKINKAVNAMITGRPACRDGTAPAMASETPLVIIACAIEMTAPTIKNASQLFSLTKVSTFNTSTPGINMTQQPSIATTMTLMERIQLDATHSTSIVTVITMTFFSFEASFFIFF